MEGKRRRGKWLTGLTTVVGAGLALAVCVKSIGAADPSPAAAEAPHAPEVAVAVIQPERVALSSEVPGRTQAYLVAEVRPQVNGIILKRCFTEGTDVKEGAVLYKIDSAPYEAAYDTAVAALAQAKANVRPLDLREKRLRDLVPSGAVSKQDYDDVSSALEQAKAQVEYCKAAVQSAKINLGYTDIKAPISGRIGRSNITVGALATAHQGAPLATIQQLDPMYVDVPQSTAQLQALRARMEAGRLSRDEAAESKVKLLMEDGTPYDLEGTLEFRDVTVDPATGSVVLRMLFPNPEHELLPNMFVRAVVMEGVSENALLVPQQAVSRTPKGDPLVLVVGDSEKVEARMLALDRTVGDQWLVSSGLTPGDRVIVEGLQGVRPGAVVKIVRSEASVGESGQGNIKDAASVPASKAS